MAYTALYRKFRPLKFSDMVGQDRITTTLKNQIISGRVGHSYLFNGGRGTGKTTSAKILARAINCLNPKDGEPCNECEICKSILEGSLTDVVEMDAASNNSVEDIRSIRDEVNFLPTKAKYRVYIIDEVHMLSIGAFNALLKTLEEPPEHVKFILATTEPQKIPMTILSRCQRFDFKRVSEEDIAKRLKVICDEASIKIDDSALKLISILAEGAVRDGISILERCYQENTDTINADLVKELVGLPSVVHINKITKAIIENNEISALQAIDDVIKEGKDLYNFLWEIVKYVKDILVYKATQKLDLYSAEELNSIKELAQEADKSRLLNIIYELSELENNIKWSSQKTIMFQTGIIKLCMQEEVVLMQSSVKATNNTKDVVKASKKSEINSSANQSQKVDEIANSNIVSEGKKADITNSKATDIKAENDDLKIEKTEDASDENIMKSKKTGPSYPTMRVGVGGEENDIWKKVIQNLKSRGKVMLFTTLMNTEIHPENDLVWDVVFFKGYTDFNKKIVEDPANKAELVKEVNMEAKKDITLKFMGPQSSESKREKKDSNIDTSLGIDINVFE